MKTEIKISKGSSLRENELAYDHECFGIAQFTRYSSYFKSFFGAESISGGGISLKISRATAYIDDTGCQRYYTNHKERELIEIRMTHTQFTDLITNMNIGSGIPVTIVSQNSERVPYADLNEVRRNNKEMIQCQFESRSKNINQDIFEIIATLGKPNIGKKDREELLNKLNHIKTEVDKNIPFYIDQVTEVIEKKYVEAKTELFSAVNQRFSELGERVLLGIDSNDLLKNS